MFFVEPGGAFQEAAVQVEDITRVRLAAGGPAERLERWLLSPALRQHMQVAGDRRHPKRTGPFIAISRQSGADGTQIARLVGEELGWDVLDKEILDFMAEDSPLFCRSAPQ
jgi:cytidylate kinase